MPGGRPKFEITQEVLDKVEAGAAKGLTKKQIARVLGISYNTLNARQKEFLEFLEAFRAGRAKGVTTITSALFKTAEGGNFPAQKHYLAINGGDKWRDVQRHEHTGEDGGPIEIEGLAIKLIKPGQENDDGEED